MGYKPKKEILSSHGGTIRKHKRYASRLYKIGVALVNMRIHMQVAFGQ